VPLTRNNNPDQIRDVGDEQQKPFNTRDPETANENGEENEAVSHHYDQVTYETLNPLDVADKRGNAHDAADIEDAAADVPKAITVRPMTSLVTPRANARPTAPRMSHSAPWYKNANPASRNRRFRSTWNSHVVQPECGQG
jgi:hypothetical protein